PFSGTRGRILDRNSKILADSTKSYDGAVIPHDIKKKDALFNFLAGVLKVDAEVLERRFQKNRLASFSPVVVAAGVTRPQVIMIEENTYLHPGLVVLERYRRRYLLGPVGGHILGYVSRPAPEKVRELEDNGYSVPESVGYTGVEEAYDDNLRGIPGGREVEVNSRGQQVRLLSVREPVGGKDIVLTIDARIQSALYDAQRLKRMPE
ncbi:MAG: hypothetical protein HQL16_06135, partial [Candidatus Omnitrophica bacterium]|nr:hypothetical protein [Candidatus Omnitrophota bacterium]